MSLFDTNPRKKSQYTDRGVSFLAGNLLAITPVDARGPLRDKTSYVRIHDLQPVRTEGKAAGIRIVGIVQTVTTPVGATEPTFTDSDQRFDHNVGPFDTVSEATGVNKAFDSKMSSPRRWVLRNSQDSTGLYLEVIQGGL